MKLLLYCTKAKPYLNDYRLMEGCNQFVVMGKPYNSLNGKIVGECDFEVEKITYRETDKNNYSFGTETLTPDELLNKSCLTVLELCKYIGSNKKWIKGDYGYAIHIKNLNIFDEPKELNEYSKRIGDDFQVLGKAPQNMMKCCEIKYMVEDYIVISIRPEWLCLIANRIKDIEVRKVVLKEMLNAK